MEIQDAKKLAIETAKKRGVRMVITHNPYDDSETHVDLMYGYMPERSYHIVKALEDIVCTIDENGEPVED